MVYTNSNWCHGDRLVIEKKRQNFEIGEQQIFNAKND